MYESFQAACLDYEEVELSMTAESLGRIPKPSTLRKSLRGLGLGGPHSSRLLKRVSCGGMTLYGSGYLFGSFHA